MTIDSVGTWPTGDTLRGSGVVAGIGLRQQATPDEILALLDLALTESGLVRRDLVGLVTWDAKARHPALCDVAALLNIPLQALPRSMLSGPMPNPSARVAGYIDLPSIAEAAASVFGPLIAEKRRSANATCALSVVLPGDSQVAASAANTASILSTSQAGS